MTTKQVNMVKGITLLASPALTPEKKQPIGVYTRAYSTSEEEGSTVMEVIAISKRIYGTSKFRFYAITDGLFTILAGIGHGISHMLKKPPKSNQLCLFPDAKLAWG